LENFDSKTASPEALAKFILDAMQGEYLKGILSEEARGVLLGYGAHNAERFALRGAGTGEYDRLEQELRSSQTNEST
jgi:hypothetical protein